MEAFRRHLDSRFQDYLAELVAYLRQPSIAAQGVGMAEGAEMTLELVRGTGAAARLIPVEGGHPVVYGELGGGERTLLIYNHYDVQPPDPLEGWHSPPFEPTIRGGHLYARGVSDDRGNLLYRLQALRAYQEVVGPLPLRVRFLIEGEEEIGSPHMEAFAREHAQLLRADGCLWEWGYRDASGRPILFAGMKGILYVELHASSAEGDLHSMYGAIAPNAAWRLVHALASLRGERDQLLLDGLEEHLDPVPPEDEPLLERIPFDPEELRATLGVPRLIAAGSAAEILRAHLYRPTITICGLRAGYIEEGLKTVLPARALAKVDFRLVPRLSPQLVLELLRGHLDRRGFQEVEIRALSAEPPAKSPTTSAVARAAVEAEEEATGREAVLWPLLPGSGPMHHLCDALGTPAISTGISHQGSAEHAPNENIRLEDYRRGLYFVGLFLERFARSGPPPA